MSEFVKVIYTIAFNNYDYAVEVNEELLSEMCSYMYTDINILAAFLNTAISNGLFDKDMYEKYSLLTSEELQKLAALIRYSVDEEFIPDKECRLLPEDFDVKLLYKSLV